MSRRFTAFISALLIGASAFLMTTGSGVATAATGAGTWTPALNGLSLVRYSFRATTLPDGQVLVEGGFAPGSYTTEAEMYDPAANAWTVVNPMHQGRGEQTATLLTDGRVLVAGGYAGPVLSSAEIFDPSSGQWQVTGSMNVNRTRQAAVRLCDGRVLAVGGWNGQELTSAEIYDPATGEWTLTPGSLSAPVSNLEAFLLPDCTVLVAGGGAGSVPSAAAYIFHPDTGMFTATASMHYARSGFSGVELPDGRVLVMGGNTPDSSTTAEEFDPATQQWSDMASMNDPHTLGTGEEAQLLPDGQVLVPGDTANGLEAELYDPAANTWSFTGLQNAVHYGGVTALLKDGRVLNAGGMDSSRTLTALGETFSPDGGMASQSISFTGPSTGTYGGTTALIATGGGSGNPVVFSIDPGTSSACAVSGTDGSTLTYTATGTCLIDANQAGGNGYAAAPQVQQTIVITPAALTVTASSGTMTWGGDPPAITPGYSGFVAGDGPASLTTQPTCSTAAASTSPLASHQPSTCSGAADANYQISYAPGVVTVVLGNYVAMGDSYSSGEGNGSYVTGTNTPADQCHRSTSSYPEYLLADLPDSTGTFTDVACSGAETWDFPNPNPKNHENPQLSALSNNVNVVTFTIGGNDVGFAEVLKQCIHVPLVDQGYGCSTDKGLLTQLTARMAALQGLASAKTPEGNLIISIPNLLKQIHQRAPKAAIFVGGYPQLFGSSTTDFQADRTAPGGYVCGVGTPPLNDAATIDYADAQWINSEADALNKAIAAGVSQAQASGVPVTYVGSVPGNFTTHRLCDSGTPWFHPLSGTIVVGQNGPSFKADPGSFHPTQAGQQDGYQVAFSRQ